MNVLKATTAAVQMHTALTLLEGFSVSVYMATVEMDLVAVRFCCCCCCCTVWFLENQSSPRRGNDIICEYQQCNWSGFLRV